MEAFGMIMDFKNWTLQFEMLRFRDIMYNKVEEQDWFLYL